MAYTAAGLHYLLEGLTKPVILTGAQLAIGEPNTDAIRNVRNALYAAAFSDINQVSLLFDKHLLKAEYATKFDAQNLNGFASFNAEPLLVWTEEFLTLPEMTVTANDSALPKLKEFTPRSEEHTSELQSRPHLVCRLLLEKKKKKKKIKSK